MNPDISMLHRPNYSLRALLLTGCGCWEHNRFNEPKTINQKEVKTMFRSTKLIVAAVMVCFAITAINSDWVLADDDCAPAPVARTGQTTCYDVDGSVIDCEGTGQDGDLQRGLPWPNPRFTDNGDGTVTDNLTQLIWLKDAYCSGTGTWTQALTDCNALAHGSCELSDDSSAGDWRLPNVKELQSMIDYSQLNPALPSGHPFTNVQSDYYWSSNTYAGYTDSAWVMYMYYGYVSSYIKTDSYSVWPVRGTSRPCAGCPEPNVDLNIKKLKIKEGKNDAKLKVDGSINLPELGISDGDIVDSRITLELFGVLLDGSDLVISSEDTLEVKYKKHLEIKKQKKH